jgi:hypothetical protein
MRVQEEGYPGPCCYFDTLNQKFCLFDAAAYRYEPPRMPLKTNLVMLEMPYLRNFCSIHMYQAVEKPTNRA